MSRWKKYELIQKTVYNLLHNVNNIKPNLSLRLNRMIILSNNSTKHYSFHLGRISGRVIVDH
jgi:hypothetical protein